jgi:hypothetical protein
MPFLLAALALGGLFCILLGVFLAACVAIAHLLHWVLPSMDLGAGAILAALGLISARWLLAWMMDEGARNRVRRRATKAATRSEGPRRPHSRSDPAKEFS